MESVVAGLIKNQHYQQQLEAELHFACIAMILDVIVAGDIQIETSFEFDLIKENLTPEELEYAKMSRDMQAEHMMKHAGHHWRFWRDIIGVARLSENGDLSQSFDLNCKRLGEEMRVTFLPFLKPLPEGQGIWDRPNH